MRVLPRFAMLAAVIGALAATAGAAAAEIPPDIVVAADGSGDFTTVQAAVASIPRESRERIVVLVKDGTYREKIRVEADCVTLRGESRDGTRIEFTQLNDDFNANPDELGRAVINVEGDDFVLENLTVENTATEVGLHAFTVYGSPDRTVVIDCNVLSTGADTLSLWNGGAGRYYHARCRMRGAVDFLCPRGWCYVEDCAFYETKPSAAMWHDGSKDRREKFVLRNCTFDGVAGWSLARHHHDAAFYFLGCRFSESMIDRAPLRVVYPLGSAPATDEDRRKNRELDRTNRWGERAYFFDCRRDGGDYAWHADNLAAATEPGAPPLAPEDVTPAWTFDGTWDPEALEGPRIVAVERRPGRVVVTFDEPVTVKGRPQLRLAGGGDANYAGGSGTTQLAFDAAGAPAGGVTAVDLNGGRIIASQASATLRTASLALPRQ